MDRRLAAILHADVVGYSRLMEGAETRTFRELKTLFDNVWLPALGRHSGRLVNTAGDAMLVEFGSAVAAVRCAMELQVTMSARNTDRPPERHVLLRIGLNIGEVIVDGDNIFGDEVNLAARIQALAEPGTVIVSSRVREAVEGKVGFSFIDLGDQYVKNITRPVHVHRVQPAEAGSDAATVLPGASSGGPSSRSQPPPFPPLASAPAGTSQTPTISAPVSRPPFQPSGPPQAPRSTPYAPAPAGPMSQNPFQAPQPQQPAPYTPPPPISWPPPQPSPSPPASYPMSTPAGQPYQAPYTPPPPQPSPSPPASYPMPTPAGQPYQAPYTPPPISGAWRLVGADRAGTPVDMRLEAGLLEQHDGVVFGRLPRYCHLTFDNDSISRRHARFKITAGGTLTVEDLGSTNGTAVDGHKIEPFRPVPVRDGSRVSLGEIKVVVSRG